MGASTTGEIFLEIANQAELEAAFDKLESQSQETRGELKRLDGQSARTKQILSDLETRAQRTQISAISARSKIEAAARAAEAAGKIFDRLSGGDKQSGFSRILGQGLAGAGEGAALGALFGPWGALIGGVGGGLIGAITEAQKSEPLDN